MRSTNGTFSGLYWMFVEIHKNPALIKGIHIDYSFHFGKYNNISVSLVNKTPLILGEDNAEWHRIEKLSFRVPCDSALDAWSVIVRMYDDISSFFMENATPVKIDDSMSVLTPQHWIVIDFMGRFDSEVSDSYDDIYFKEYAYSVERKLYNMLFRESKHINMKYDRGEHGIYAEIINKLIDDHAKEIIESKEEYRYYLKRYEDEIIRLKEKHKKILDDKKGQKRTVNNQHTYLIYDGTYYKIGKSVSPDRRIKEIRSHNPQAELIHTIPADVETELHRKYSECRVENEWYNLQSEQVSEIVSYSHN